MLTGRVRMPVTEGTGLTTEGRERAEGKGQESGQGLLEAESPPGSWESGGMERGPSDTDEDHHPHPSPLHGVQTSPPAALALTP